MALTKAKASNILLTTPAASSNDVTPATTQYVTTAIANLADSAPSTLNTLNELAAALGDDANFSTTVTNSIATKLPLAGGTMTGNIVMGDNNISEINKLEIFDSLDNNRLGIYGTASNSFIFDLEGTGSQGNISFNDFKVGIGTTTQNKLFNLADPLQGGEALKLHFEADSSADKWGIYAYDRTNGHYANMSLGQNGIFITGADNPPRIGMGTTSPNYNLEVQGSRDDNWISRIYNTHANGYGLLVRSDCTSANNKIALGVYADSAYRLAVLANGKVGINLTAPTAYLDVRAPSGVSSPNVAYFKSDQHGLGVYVNVGSTHSEIRSNNNSYPLVLNTSSGGIVCIGDTTGYPGGHDAVSRLQLTGGGCVLAIRQTDATDPSHRVVALFTDNGGTYRGRITINNSSCSFTAASDYRLKENVETLSDGLDRLKQLKPVKFKWKEHDYTSEGFIAHEVQEVYPDAVVGEKDGEVMQSIDYGKITPLLVKAIQEQQTIIDDLKTRIETLEG